MNLDELKSLTSSLPEPELSEQRSEALRKSLLEAVESESPRSSRQGWGPVLAVAVAAVLAFYAGVRQGRDTQEHEELAVSLAALGTSDGASFEHLAREGARPDEEVRLSKGTLRVDMETPESRTLLVVTRDAQVRGLNTLKGKSPVFEVSASGDELRSVTVESGRVEVLVHNQAAIILGPGQSWATSQESEVIELAVGTPSDSAPVPPDTAAIEEEPAPAPSPAPAPTRASSSSSKSEGRAKIEVTPSAPTHDDDQDKPLERPARRSSPELALTTVIPELKSLPRPNQAELAFDAGYRALRSGDTKRAIAELQTAIATGGDEPLRGDSRYWRGIALARAGRKAEAMRSMSEFLHYHSSSSRAGEVATMLAWFALEDGQLERAAALFEQGKGDPSARIRESARAGLKAIRDSQR